MSTLACASFLALAPLAGTGTGGDSFSVLEFRPGEPPEADFPIDVAITPDAAQALVLHRDSDNLAFYDMADRRFTGIVAVGHQPRELALSPDGRFALTADQGSDTVSVVSLADRSVVARLAVGEEPVAVRVTGDGARAYVANFEGQSLTAIDLDRLEVVGTVEGVHVTRTHADYSYYQTLEHFAGFELAQDGRTALVVDGEEGGLQFVDLAALAVDGFVPAAGIRSVAVTPRGNVAAVVQGGTGWDDLQFHTRIDVATRRVISRSGFQGQYYHGRRHVMGPRGERAYFDRLGAVDMRTGELETGAPSKTPDVIVDGRGHWVASTGTHVSISDPETLDLVVQLSSGYPTQEAGVAPIGNEAVAVQRSGVEGLVHFRMDGEESEILAQLTTEIGLEGDDPWGAVVSDDGTRAVVSNNLTDNLTLIDLAAGEVTGHVQLEASPYDLALTPDGRTLLVGMAVGTDQHRIDVYALDPPEVLASLPVTLAPLEIGISPDGSMAVVATTEFSAWGIDEVVFLELDGADSTYAGRIQAGNFLPWDLSTQFKDAGEVVFTPDGEWALLASRFTDEILVVDVQRRRLFSKVAVPYRPTGLVVRADGREAAVGTYEGVTFLALQDGDASVVASIELLYGVQRRLAYAPDGSALYAGAENIVAIETAGHTVATTLETGSWTTHLALTGDGRRLAVSVGEFVDETYSLWLIEADGTELSIADVLPFDGGFGTVATARSGDGVLLTRPGPDLIDWVTRIGSK